MVAAPMGPRSKSKFSMGIKESPVVSGMLSLTWAMTSDAFSTAAFVASTDTPRLHNPSLFGGATWTRAASTPTGRCG